MASGLRRFPPSGAFLVTDQPGGRPAGRRRAARRALLASSKDHASLVSKDTSLAHNRHMRDASGHSLPGDNRGLWQQVQLARGRWRREDAAGATRSGGWWESVTVTWSPAPTPERRPAVLQRALAAAADMIAPVLADVAVTSARRVLQRRHHRLVAASLLRRPLVSAARELPRTGRIWRFARRFTGLRAADTAIPAVTPAGPMNPRGSKNDTAHRSHVPRQASIL